MNIFVSHSASSVRHAVRFKELIKNGSKDAAVFLSSDWESIPSGSIWLQQIEDALSKCDYLFVLIIEASDATSLWINYEVGFARGRKLLPKIIVFSGIPPATFEYPLRGIHLLFHGDTNRWMLEFSQIGLKITPELQAAFAALFEKRI
jgi:hypothetical protein